MGYYSDWTVEVESPLDIADLSDVLGEATAGYYWEHYGDGEARMWQTKWYDWEEDIRGLSQRYPEAYFTVTRLTEDHEQDSKTTWHGGVVHKRYRLNWVEVH